MRNPFHGVSTDISEALTFGADPRLFGDAVLEQHAWTGARASANSMIDGANGLDGLFHAAADIFAHDFHQRHGHTIVAGTESSTFAGSSANTDLQPQTDHIHASHVDAAHVHADSSTHATISHAVHAPASLETSANLSGANAALSAPSAAAAAPTTYPDDTNTGVTSGSKLQVYTGTYVVTEDNAVISNLEVHGDIVIDAKNVTMSNIKLVSNTPWHALRVMDDATGFTLKDSDIDGGGHTVNAIFGYGTFLRNNLHGVENGINVTGPALIRDNYIHDLSGGPDAHFDGIENNGAPDMQLIHNTIVNDNSQTSAVMLDNYFGGLSNITIDDNRLVGGGYTVYLDGRFGGGTVDDSSIRITNNQIGDGLWGNYSFYDDKPILSGNVGLGQTPVSAIAATVYTGTSGNDSLLSTANASTRNETYEGFDGNDFLQGGAGADALNGGNGSDTASYVGSATGVNVNLQTGAASGGYAAGDTFVNIENLLGSSFSDTLTGNSGVDFLNGNAGADTLIGGAGNDGYFIDNIGDVVIEAPGGGEDHVYSSVSYALGANVEHLTLTGGASVNATGNELNNWIAGNSGANTVSGGAGDDTLYGNSGDDVIDGGSGNDLVEGQGGNDRLTGGAGVDRFMFRQNAVASTGADHITDFSSGDKLLFDVTSGPTGPLNANAFRVGTTALDADDRFIYDQCSHTLYYDSDGNGSAGKVQIAVFDNGYALTAGDIQLW